MIEIRAAARVHFGLVDVVPPFGGAGVMIDEPTTLIRCQPAHAFDVVAEDSARDRALDLIDRFLAQWKQTIQSDQPIKPFRLEVVARPPSHHGLGTGTQLALAICEAIWLHAGRPDPFDWTEVAQRGARSRVGSFGYARGGFILDDEKGCAHFEMPDAWRIAFLRPKQLAPTVHGKQEDACFAELPPAEPSQRSAMREVLYEQLLPAAKNVDFECFAAAATRLNRLSGELFRPVQNGVFQSKAVADLIDQIEAIDPRLGVGQSSWGPGIFVLCPDTDVAETTTEKLRDSAECLAISRISRQGRTHRFA